MTCLALQKRIMMLLDLIFDTEEVSVDHARGPVAAERFPRLHDRADERGYHELEYNSSAPQSDIYDFMTGVDLAALSASSNGGDAAL
eukprot:8287358-Pyramimonas_sp.AAC.1